MRTNGMTAAATLLASCLVLGSQSAAAQNAEPTAEDQAKADTSNKANMSTKADSSAKANTSARSDTSKSSSTGEAGALPPNHPAVVLVPIVLAENDGLAGGCWARLYDSEGFKGGMLTLVGPVDIADTRPLPVTGVEFGTNYDSVAVGPNATLKIWDGNNYTNQAATFAAGQKVSDMDTRMGPMEDIESLRVSCTNKNQ